MAKTLLNTYTFTPGTANVGTVVVPGTFTLEQFLLITNVTTGAIIYQFNSSTKGGAVTTGGGNTTLTLETNTSAMSAGNRLQIFVDDGGAAPISASSLPLPSGASTAANQTTANSSLSSIDGKLPALSSGRVPVDVGSSINVGEVEVKNDSGNPIPISDAGGSITVDGTVGISGTVPVSGPLTDTQLRATAVPVSGTVTATGPLTDTQLRAAAVPVSTASLPLPTGAATQTTLASVDGKLPALDTGSVPVLVKNGQLEITNDTGNPLPVGTAAQLNVTGSASANNTDLISVACDSYRTVNFQITGTWVGTITYQGSNDNVNWVTLNVIGLNATAVKGTDTANIINYAALVGVQYFRARFTAYTSGTASINAYFSRDAVPTATLPVSPSSPTNTVVGSATSSGVTLYTVNSAATTNAANIKSTAANLYGISAMNTSASTKYVRFYSKATAPTVGTDVPIMVVAIPATSSKEIEYVPALRIATGLGVAITGGAAATDTTAVAAGDVQLLVSYA